MLLSMFDDDDDDEMGSRRDLNDNWITFSGCALLFEIFADLEPKDGAGNRETDSTRICAFGFNVVVAVVDIEQNWGQFRQQ